MALDQPPMNRAQRRAAAHKKGKTIPLGLPQRAPRQPSQSRNARQDQAIGTGATSAEEDEMAEAQEAAPSFAAFMTGGDTAPARKSASHHKGGSKNQRIYDGLVSYYGFAGMLISTRNPADGMLIAGEAERLAGLWLDAGKSSPAIMRVLELLTVAGPYTALVFAHGQIALALMSNHGVSPFSLFARADQPVDSPQDGQTGRGAAPAPLPYQPAGPFAPTDTAAMPLTVPPPVEDGLRVYPDVELPSDLDVALRQAARQSGRPYKELADEARLQIAQIQIAQNGHVQAPGALGAPVARE